MITEPGGTLLLDMRRGKDEEFDVSFLEDTGHPVIVCEGPPDSTLCPLLGGKGCAKFESAHGVLFQLDLDRAQHRAILRRYRELREDLPIRVVVSPDQAVKYASLLDDFEVWTHEPTVADLDGFAAEVEAADLLVAAGS